MSFIQARKHKFILPTNYATQNWILQTTANINTNKKWNHYVYISKANCTLALIRRNLKLAPDKVKAFTCLDHKSSVMVPLD